MKPRRVRFTAAAQQQLDIERTWWIKNRDQRELFATELERSLAILATHPRVGRKQRSIRFKRLRRALLRKTLCYIYYTVHADAVVIRAVWGARRKRGPRI